MTDELSIALIEPYFAGSHKSWAESLAAKSKHNYSLYTMPGRYWKWRMHGGAVELSSKFLSEEKTPDLILATDMLDFSNFLALTRKTTGNIPTALYFHENQLSYPWPEHDSDLQKGRNLHYGFINYSSALAADRCFFNSEFHMNSFLEEVEKMLKHFPDFNCLESVKSIREKSSVLPLGFDFSKLDAAKEKGKELKAKHSDKPIILWNHRWEYDKNPQTFFDVLYQLDEECLPFSLAVLGESFGKLPGVFNEASKRLKDRIVQWGFAESYEDYAAWLWASDLLPVTSIQDFFGISVVEAAYCGCTPLLPNRLAYPEVIPASEYGDLFYNTDEELINSIKKYLDTPLPRAASSSLSNHVHSYSWDLLAGSYDDAFGKLAASAK